MACLEFLTLIFKNKFSSFCSSRILGLLKSRANPPFDLNFLVWFCLIIGYRMSWIRMSIGGGVSYPDDFREK